MCVVATWESQLTVILRLAAPGENTLYVNFFYSFGHLDLSHVCNCNLGIPINRETQACSPWWKYNICEYLLLFRAPLICRMCVVATWGFQLTVRLRLAAFGESTICVKFYYTLGHQYYSHVWTCNLGIPINRETQACSSWWEYGTCEVSLLCRAPVSFACVSLRPVVFLVYLRGVDYIYVDTASPPQWKSQPAASHSLKCMYNLFFHMCVLA